MNLANSIQIIAILIECAVVVIAVLIATWNNRVYGWLIAITFALFALFDGIRIFFPYGFPRLYSLVLFVACASMLYAVWLMYNETRKSD